MLTDWLSASVGERDMNMPVVEERSRHHSLLGVRFLQRRICCPFESLGMNALVLGLLGVTAKGLRAS